MNAAVTIMQAMDWKKYDLEGWLYQFGAWMRFSAGTCSRSVNPIAVAMDKAIRKRKQKISAAMKKQIIVDYMASDYEQPKPKSHKTVCAITDDEARAVQRLVLDLMGQSEVMDEWLDAIIDRYFYGNSWAKMERKSGSGRDFKIIYSQMDARFDVKCGLAILHSRYSFIDYSKV